MKIFVHVFPAFHGWHIAGLSMLCFGYTAMCNARPLIYFFTKVFFNSILSIFFNDVQVVGHQNIPRYGPVIFTSNHANQFIDGLMIMCTCRRTISYLVAEKSWKRAVVGHLAWAMQGVPVKRAQDAAKRGQGGVRIEWNTNPKVQVGAESEDEDEQLTETLLKVVGRGTKFGSELKVGDKIRPAKMAQGLKVERIDGDECLWVQGGSSSSIPADAVDADASPSPSPYDVLPHINQKDVYESVLEKLASGGTIGIFPEGGSHDRTDLLPLKVGVSLIAYMSLEKDAINIPIVPVGLNYFRAHRFRGKATVEFGSPTYIDPNTLDDFKKGGIHKHKACNDLLERIEDNMRSVIVSVPDHETLQIIHACRRLYRQDGANESAQQRQDMGRRFAEGFKRLQLSGDAKPREWADVQTRLVAYQKELNDLGMRDYQVVGLDREEVELTLTQSQSQSSLGHSRTDTVLHRMNVLGHICHLVCVSALAALPALFLNLPVGLAARIYSSRRRKVALAASKVKVKAYDVVLSERVLACIVLVPSLWIFYGAALRIFTNLDGPSLAVCFACFPLFSYSSIRATESGMVDVKDLRPYVMRLIPSARRRLAALPAVRKELQRDLRALIREVGPSLGNIYYDKDLNWQEIEMERRAVSTATTEGEGEMIREEEKEMEIKKEE